MKKGLARNIELVTTVSALGCGVIDRCLIGIGFIGSWLSAKISPKGWCVPVRISLEGKPVRIVLRHFSDFLVLYEMFVMKEYAVEGSFETIFDVGANVGFSALFFASRFPDARIYAFEPDPHTFRQLRENTGSFPNIHAINRAVGAEDGTLPFYVYPGSSISSSLVRRLPSQEKIDVPVCTVSSVMSELAIERIDLLKFDVEGSEIAVLKGLRNPESVKRFIGEIHLDLIAEDPSWLDEYFAGRTMTRHDISSSRYILAVS